jgi:hypothetical protein
MVGEGQQSLAEFPRVRGALFLGGLHDWANHRDRLAVIGDDSGVTAGGGSRELGETRFGFTNTDRLQRAVSRPRPPQHQPPGSQGVTTFPLDLAVDRLGCDHISGTLHTANVGVTTIWFANLSPA